MRIVRFFFIIKTHVPDGIGEARNPGSSAHIKRWAVVYCEPSVLRAERRSLGLSEQTVAKDSHALSAILRIERSVKIRGYRNILQTKADYNIESITSSSILIITPGRVLKTSDR
jgi:hypothetical protein